jgi:FtsP/CotA-like multicopper oxidase with cupredoxin domain
MKKHSQRLILFLASLALCLPAVIPGESHAVMFRLCADETSMALPGGVVVPLWGFGTWQADGSCTNVSVPGPALEVPPGDSVLEIRFKNNLPEHVSLYILGQTPSRVEPVWTRGTSNTVVSTVSRAAGDYTARVRSFNYETPPDGSRVYEWNNFKAGTYLLQSGANPAKQVQMGLYASVVKDTAANLAYPGVPYDNDLVLIFHELDPDIHQAIANGTYGARAGSTITSSIYRKPRYFLINGRVFTPGSSTLNPFPITGGQRILLRFINAGYETHVPQVMRGYLTVWAEDGIPHAHAMQQTAVELAAAKTVDAIYQAPAGSIPLYDARLSLTNAGTSPGGMLGYLAIGPAVP